MRMRPIGVRTTTNGLLLVGIVLLGAGLCSALACGMDYTPPPSDLAKAALSDDPAAARAAIAALRAKGPAGLEELTLPYHRRTNDPRVSAAIDAVAAQKDAAYSGLYWYTDIEQAKAAARAQEKPILSLRLLGNLDSEYSCANSRFFRTTLYANAEVSRALRDRFVLHWKSVRPVPKVTIDMGDGRVICRTVTGNSIHYVLDAQGRTVDALPGLYGPQAFLRLLGDAEQVERTMRSYREAPEERARVLADWHARRGQAIDEAWDQDLRTIGVIAPVTALTAGPGTSVPVVPPVTTVRTAPTALQAMPRAVSKSIVEVKLVKALDPVARAALETSTDDAAWAKIAALPAHAADAKLDGASRQVMRAKLPRPTAEQAARLAMSKLRQEDPVLKVAAKFERSAAEDTVRNEYGFHRKLHQWFAERVPETQDPAGPDRLNEKVYAELFLTPGSDPWLGLAPEDAYTALEGGGVGGNAE
jgi:hypothetical protein